MLYVKFLDGQIMRQNHIPPGIINLISAFENKGITVDFRDYQLVESEEIFNINSLLDFLDNPSRIIGLSCMANLLPFVLLAVPHIKKRFPDRTLILGGVGTAGVEQEILERFRDIDIIHRGEGDISAPMLIHAILQNKSLENIPSISYHTRNGIKHNDKAPRVMDLDSLPLPAYHVLNFKQYDGHNILGSRGCPFQCTFCSITPVWGWKSYSRTNDNVIHEMKIMNEKYGVEEFLFQDEYFVSSPKRAIDFSKKLRKSKLNVEFKAFARIDLVTKESLKALAKAGCIELRFGIESGSDKILAKTKKGFTSEQALKKIALAKKYIPAVDAFYVWGFPFETMVDFRKTLLQMVTLRSMGIRCLPSLLTYLPQTIIYKELEQPDQLEFCHYLLPEYMVTGIENRLSVRVEIDNLYSSLFEFIQRNKDIFPGYFHCDIKNNINPKLKLLEEFGFYNQKQESCGAHSPSKIKNKAVSKASFR